MLKIRQLLDGTEETDGKIMQEFGLCGSLPSVGKQGTGLLFSDVTEKIMLIRFYK